MEQFDGQFLLEVWEVYRQGLLLCWYQGLEEQLKRFNSDRVDSQPVVEGGAIESIGLSLSLEQMKSTH